MNGAGDGVAALSARTLLRSAYQSLEWELPYFMSFPELPFQVAYCQAKFSSCTDMETQCKQNKTCCLAFDYGCANPPGPKQPKPDDLRLFQTGVGAFLRNGEPGFRGLDFQARLVFEDRFGACDNPGKNVDFVGKLVAQAVAKNGPLADAVSALKDRLIGDPRVSEPAERQQIERLFSGKLEQPVAAVKDLEKKMRTLCGVLLSTPQFLLSGPGAGTDLAPEPTLTPKEASYDELCKRLAERGFGDGRVAIQCSQSGLVLDRRMN
jgi:hypothetical protein